MSSRSTSSKDAMLALIPNLRAFAYSLCGHGELVDDMVQETLLKAWHHLDSFQEGTNLRAWLFTILRNTYFSDLRKRRREVGDTDGLWAEALCVAPPSKVTSTCWIYRRRSLFSPQNREKRLFLLPPPASPTSKRP